MPRLKETLRILGFGVVLPLGMIACGGNKGVNKSQKATEIAELQSELNQAKIAAQAGQKAIDAYKADLKPDCLTAAVPFVGNGAYADTKVYDNKYALGQTTPWCGPDQLSAVPDLRALYNSLFTEQSNVDRINTSIAADLASIDVKAGS